MFRTNIVTLQSLGLCAFGGAPPAQRLPPTPIRVVRPFGAGGPADMGGRAIVSKFPVFLGQRGVV